MSRRYKNAVQKAFKFFDRNNLGDQSAIAKEIKDQVKSFEPYVPIVVALRNQGMRPRHWRQVGSALGLCDFEPGPDFTLTKLLELNPASQEELITKVRASVYESRRRHIVPRRSPRPPRRSSTSSRRWTPCWATGRV